MRKSSNRAVRAVSQKEKFKRVKNNDLAIDNASRKFILMDLGLLGSSFINCDI